MTEVYYKIRQVFYYKMGQLLQIATILLENATVITKCVAFYKLRQHSMQCINPIQSQIIKLEPRPTLKKSGFSVQIIIKLTF